MILTLTCTRETSLHMKSGGESNTKFSLSLKMYLTKQPNHLKKISQEMLNFP